MNTTRILAATAAGLLASSEVRLGIAQTLPRLRMTSAANVGHTALFAGEAI